MHDVLKKAIGERLLVNGVPITCYDESNGWKDYPANLYDDPDTGAVCLTISTGGSRSCRIIERPGAVRAWRADKINSASNSLSILERGGRRRSVPFPLTVVSPIGAAAYDSFLQRSEP